MQTHQEPIPFRVPGIAMRLGEVHNHTNYRRLALKLAQANRENVVAVNRYSLSFSRYICVGQIDDQAERVFHLGDGGNYRPGGKDFLGRRIFIQQDLDTRNSDWLPSANPLKEMLPG